MLLVLHLVLFSILALITVQTGMSQEPPSQPFPDGFGPAQLEKFLGIFLEEETPEERKAIEGVAVSVREERKYGNRAADAFLDQLRDQGIEVQSRGRDVDYVRQLIDVLQPQMRHKNRYRWLQVLVAESDQTDAIAFPGGTVVVSRGLLDLCGSEAALVGVLGHELSHLDHGHQLHLVRRMKLVRQSSDVPGRAAGEQLMGDGVMLLKAFLRPFRPEDEVEADADGATWSYRAGYDPREMAQLFTRMARRAGEPRMVPMYFRSHPANDDRARAVNALYSQLQVDDPKETLHVGRENLKQRVTRGERDFAD